MAKAAITPAVQMLLTVLGLPRAALADLGGRVVGEPETGSRGISRTPKTAAAQKS